MDRKQLFINWISARKLRFITPENLSNTLEHVFLSFYQTNVWNISDPEKYNIFKTSLISNKEFRKKDKKSFTILMCYGSYYHTFLKMNDFKNSEDEQLDKIDSLINDEKNKILNFFSDEKIATIFYELFVYSKNNDEKMMLDVRSSIIGIKRSEELLRYYSDRNGFVRFVGIKKTANIAETSNEELCRLIDDTDLYFENHKAETLKNNDFSSNQYVYHASFGFGEVVSKTNKYITILFDNCDSEKTLQLDYPLYFEISKEDYLSKHLPNNADRALSVKSDSSITKRVAWDKYETALLIEAFWKIENKKECRKDVLTKLSESLRRKAINQGRIIDETFRNYNGMSIQLGNIALSFFPDRPAMHRTAIFDEVANLYKTNREEFNIILNEAHQLVGDFNKEESNNSMIKYEQKSNVSTQKVSEKTHAYSIEIKEADFYTFVKEGYLNNHKDDGKAHRAPKHAQKCIERIREMNKLLGIDIYAFKSKDEIKKVYLLLHDCKLDDSQYKWYSYVLNKYLRFVSTKVEPQNDGIKNIEHEKGKDIFDYYAVIQSFFPDGYAFNNPLRKKKFIREYLEINKKEFSDSDKEYLKKIGLVGFVSEEKVYLSSIVSKETKDQIKFYIDSNFTHGESAIYYSTIYLRFNDCLNSSFSEDMLKHYLQFEFGDLYRFDNSFISKKGENVNLKQMLINIFMNCGCPLELEDIYRRMPNISHKAVDDLIKDKDFLVNYRGRSYFYKDIFVIDNNELENIKQFIDKTIKEKESLSGSEVYNFIKDKLPNVIDSNPDVTELGYKNVLKMKFDGVFNFKGDVISAVGNELDARTLFTDFCKLREAFTFSDLEGFKDSINKNYIDWEGVLLSAIRINENNFVRRNLVTFDAEKIDGAINSYCSDEYISFNDIINFTEFPTMEFPWNNYVLESYLLADSKKFKLIHSAFNSENPVGGIVKVNSKIANFDDLIVMIIKDKKLFEREKAFNYLLENNFIKRRQIKNIDLLIEKARKEG